MRRWRRSKLVDNCFNHRYLVSFPFATEISLVNNLIYLFAAELMILGFISLTLVFSQYYIAEICIPTSVADTMLPCSSKEYNKDKEESRRRLLSYERRVLASKASGCTKVIAAFLLKLGSAVYLVLLDIENFIIFVVDHFHIFRRGLYHL